MEKGNRGGKRAKKINRHKESHDREIELLNDAEWRKRTTKNYLKTVSRAHSDFFEKTFDGLYQHSTTGEYMSMSRVSNDKTKIVVNVANEHLVKTKYGWGLILDEKHVVWLKNWQVNENWYGNEVLLNKAYFNVKEWGHHEAFGSEPQNLKWKTWLDTAREQQDTREVKWRMKETSAQRDNSLFGHGKYYQ